jgi:hypothetical protein
MVGQLVESRFRRKKNMANPPRRYQFIRGRASGLPFSYSMIDSACNENDNVARFISSKCIGKMVYR